MGRWKFPTGPGSSTAWTRRERTSRSTTGRLGTDELERRDEGLLVAGAVVPDPVDEQGGRAVHPAPHPLHERVADVALVAPVGQVHEHGPPVDPGSLCITRQILVFQGLLVLEQQIVHGPERRVAP